MWSWCSSFRDGVALWTWCSSCGDGEAHVERCTGSLCGVGVSHSEME